MMRYGFTLTILAATAAAPACSNSLDPIATPDAGTPIGEGPPTGTSGGSDTTFDHDNNTISPWDLINRLEVEGPPSFTSHMHSCPKVTYKNLGRILTSVGVNASNTAALSAGDLYTGGFNAMGGPNFANRIRENLAITTSGSSREFDIFAAAADEVIAALPTIPRCQVGGVGPVLFDGNQCRADGISCLIGQPATLNHLDLCNLAITSASTPAIGKRIAVASLLAAAYTCE